MKKVLLLILFVSVSLIAGNKKNAAKWSERIVESFIKNHPANNLEDSLFGSKWTYDTGVLFEGIRQAYEENHNQSYFNYMKLFIDQYVQNDGTIKTYKFKDFNIDNINTGKTILFLAKTTKEAKYKIAADTLRKQLLYHPRTPSNGFWHKKIYPNQMWLDGIYMGQPFLAQYSALYNEPNNFDDIVHQFELIEKNTYDPKTGLLYHAWDESKKMKWADPETGHAPNFWSRAMGWYAMALVDVLDFMPKDHPKREILVNLSKKLAEALVKVQDAKTGLWYQVPNLPKYKGNYLEGSGSAMFTYFFAKGVNNGYLDKKYLKNSRKGFDGLIKYLTTIDKNGTIYLKDICRGAGLGGNPYRDGSVEYYINEVRRTNDLKGYGPFIMTAVELEKANVLQK